MSVAAKLRCSLLYAHCHILKKELFEISSIVSCNCMHEYRIAASTQQLAISHYHNMLSVLTVGLGSYYFVE